MFSRYRRILSVPGALRFSVSALIARLPMAMVTIGIVLLVTGVGRSYGLAGVMSAAYLLAAAALAIPQARLVDRLGQAPVLTVAAFVFAVGLTVFVVTVEGHGTAIAWLDTHRIKPVRQQGRGSPAQVSSSPRA